MRKVGSVLTVGLGLLAGGCATRMYDGRERPRRELAVLDRSESQTRVVAIDGRAGGGGSHFAILPGMHTLTLGLEGSHVNEDGVHYDYASLPPLTVCFQARAGHTYAVRLRFRGSRSKPEIFDREDDQEIPAPRIDSPSANCVAEEEEEPPAGETAASPTAAPSAAYEIPGASSPPAVQKRKHRLDRAWTGAAMEFGLAFGGDTLVTAIFTDGSQSKLSAGDGFSILVGGEWTPFRSLGHHGFGFGLAGGVKYDGVSGDNGSIRFIRFPVLLSTHALLHVRGTFFFLMRGGIETDLRPSLWGDGLASGFNANLSSKLGGFGESGGYWQSEGDFGVSITLRYTWIKYTYAGASFDASSLGVLAAFHVSL